MRFVYCKNYDEMSKKIAEDLIQEIRRIRKLFLVWQLVLHRKELTNIL